MLRVLDILNDIDEEWEAPARESHSYHMELLDTAVTKPFTVDHSHNLAILFANC